MTANKKNLYVVIMAGGSGTRLWPLSRSHTPKQFQKLVSDQSLIQDAYDRVKGLVPKNQLYVATLTKYKGQVLEALPEIDEAHLILEPSSKNSAPSIAYLSNVLASMDKDAVVATVPSDHTVDNLDKYAQASLAGLQKVASSKNTLVTIGIKPTSPNTGLGYLKMGQRVDEINNHEIFTLEEFKEKPDLATATFYLKNWRYLWNGGYYFFRATDMIKWLTKVRPELIAGIKKILALQKTPDDNTAEINKIWESFDNEQIEYALIEGMKGVLTIPANLGWDDVGTWNSLYDMFHSKNGQSLIAKGDQHFNLDSTNTFVYSDKKLIVTVGVDDLVVVDSPDVTLVMKKSQSGKIKELLAELKKKKTHGQYL